MMNKQMVVVLGVCLVLSIIGGFEFYFSSQRQVLECQITVNELEDKLDFFVLEKEIERVGVPAVLITTLLPTAKLVGANRVVQGIAVTSPVGNPRVSNKEERAIRKKMLESAFELLASEMPDQHDTEK